MKKTMKQAEIERMQAQGYRLVGETHGWLSFRKGSNLAGLLARLGLTAEQVEVRAAARVGKWANDGCQLLIFVK